jgi:CheY-like chemotaxis protein
MMPEDVFVKEVRAFLSNLYDHTDLVKSPLVGQLAPHDTTSAVQAMRHVRSLVLEVLEQMNPGPRVPFRSPPAQSYNILRLRYVEGMTVQEVAQEMATSERTLYRDLRKAEEDLAVLLSAHIQPTQLSPENPEQGTGSEQVLAEVQRLDSGVTEVGLASFLQSAVRAVESLGQSRGARLRVRLPGDDELACLDPVLTRQVLIGALSRVIQHSEPGGQIVVEARCRERLAEFEISCWPSADAACEELFPSTAEQLLVQLDGTWTASRDSSGQMRIVITLGGESRCLVLVIDDNESLFQLFQRYLADAGYRLIGARDGHEGLRLAEQLAPDVVVLDIMMPQHDGWEVLQWFRTEKATRHIPVVVCTVLDDPELALSLGATDFLNKPVTRASLLRTLSRYRRDTQPRSDPGSPEGTR